MSRAHHPTPLPQGLGIPVLDWQRTPTRIRDECLALLNRGKTASRYPSRQDSVG
ncbi:MAG: hypothetical protein OEU26_03255 [Candidatus Tectomicrobia bacterium]|nr:hypothetical protein [Candidatus Tectomicrobia bacterium]